MPNKITRKELLEEISRLRDELGRKPQAEDMTKHGKYSKGTYYNRFESWNEACRLVGIEPDRERNIDSEKLIKHLQCLADDLGRPPRQQDVVEHADYGLSTYVRRFGSIKNAREEAGLPRKVEYPSVSDEELIKAIIDLTDDLGKPPTASEIKQHGRYTQQTYLNHFESIYKAREKAGVGHPPRARDIVTKDGLLQHLLDLKEELDRVPNTYDIAEYGKHSQSSYQRHFGGFNPALKMVGLEPRPRMPSGEDHPNWKGGAKPRRDYGSNWQEVREDVLERDSNECVRCGVTEGQHLEKYGGELHVHHRRPLREFDEPEDANTLDNLITLCCSCHKTLENLPVQPAAPKSTAD